MNNRKEAKAAGRRGLIAAGEVLKLGFEDLSPKDKKFIAEAVQAGHFFEVIYSGILGKDGHVRVAMVGPDAVSREMFRIQLT
jgi:hypothetical protein